MKWANTSKPTEPDPFNILATMPEDLAVLQHFIFLMASLTCDSVTEGGEPRIGETKETR